MGILDVFKVSKAPSIFIACGNWSFNMLAVFILQCSVFVVISLNVENKNTQIKAENSQHLVNSLENGQMLPEKVSNRQRRERKLRKKTKKRNKVLKLKRKKQRTGKKQMNKKNKDEKTLKGKKKNKQATKSKKKKKSTKTKHKNMSKGKNAIIERAALSGDNCQWLDFGTARSRGANCADGTKMVIRNKRGVRKQFLLTNEKTIYGFATRGEKLPDCSSLTEITGL